MTVATASLAEPLAAGLAALRLEVPNEARERLLRYVDLLAKWNAVYNLTAIREPARMLPLHLFDSLAVLPTLDALVRGLASVRVLDVGSGAGLPGLPIAIARPAWQVLLREPTAKKTAFIKQAIAELRIANAQASLGRVEDLRSPPGFAIVIARAFADLASFAAASLAQLDAEGRLCAMKAARPTDEIARLPASVVVEREVVLDVPGVEGDRTLIVLKRRDAPRKEGSS